MASLRALLLVPLFLLAACGGGSSPPPAASVSAPSSLSYPPSPVLAVSQAITPLAPTVTGSVSSYSISPSLPAGLSISQTSGTISGTPTAGAALATYTVTATNAGGSTTAAVPLMVIDSAPDVAYAQIDYKFVRGIAVTAPAPTNAGGLAASWSIDHPLPIGLTFNTADGSITGTPTAITPSATYVISAANAIGTDSIALTISVESGVLIELGNVTSVTGIDYEGNRVLSHDRVGHWALWNAQTGKMLAQGESACDLGGSYSCEARADIAGPTMVVNSPLGLQIRASSDGSELATLTRSQYSWWRLASDGSYIVSGDSTGLTVWAPNGTTLFTKSGNYGAAKAFGAAGELRLVGGAQGANVLERLAVPSGSSTTTGPLLGQIHSWFLDGEHFITNAGNTIWVYSATGVLAQGPQAMSYLGQLTGQGNWFWTFSDSATGLTIYEVGGSTTPAANYPLPSLFYGVSAQGSRDSIFVRFGESEYSVIDLSGASPAKTDYTSLPHDGVYAAASSTDWVNGNGYGVVTHYDNGTPTYLSEGQLQGLAVSATRIALGTAAGKIHFFDAGTFEEEGTIDADVAGLDISNDGTVLLAPPRSSPSTMKVFALPAGNEIVSYTSTGGSLSLSPSGQEWTLARPAGVVTSVREIRSIADNSLLWSDSSNTATLVFSPSGTSVAAPNAGPRLANTSTNMFTNYALAGAATGYPLTWLDENRLLVTRYISGLGGHAIYQGSFIVDRSGLDVGSPALPELTEAVRVSPTSIYSPARNVIYSVTTGQPIWSSPNPAPRVAPAGGVTATHVVFYSGTTVRAEPY